MTGMTLHLRIVIDILGAYLLALPVGWEREEHERSAGLRTFPLVAVAACALAAVVASTSDIAAQSRVVQGLIGGIGFIGGGTILKTGLTIRGTATAASILVTAVLGVSVAYHLYDVAFVLSVLSLITLRLFEAWKHLEPGIHKWDPDSLK
jgi:putative Mg2+ transporter-C (MgtC) family protein